MCLSLIDPHSFLTAPVPGVDIEGVDDSELDGKPVFNCYVYMWPIVYIYIENLF